MLKFVIISFEDFQKVTINLHKCVNMLDAKINVHWDTKKNNQIRLFKWITCETDSDKSNLEERFGLSETSQRFGLSETSLNTEREISMKSNKN